MSAFWQAKIWGLLHDPALKALHDNTGRGTEGVWRSLSCMEGWISPKAKSLAPSSYSSQWLKHIGLCDLIASASDRAAIGRLPATAAINYNADGLEIRHLLSGKSQQFRLGQWHDWLMSLGSAKAEQLAAIEDSLIPDEIRRCQDTRKVFWWFWRCYPQVLARALNRDGNTPNEPCLPLLPADTRIPDASLWSHVSMTSALAGSLAGYHSDPSAYPAKRARKGKDYYESRPHVAIFSFTPVQELIKASRKMRDFWAGSWLLHYLSAKVSWSIAWKYGPDTLLYPCLYAQPLIDLWLLQAYPDFKEWLDFPKERQLLTAGFPNVLVTILPDNGANSTPDNVKNPIVAAMQYAEQALIEEWMSLGKDVLENLQTGSQPWMKDLNPHTWGDWLKAQWQTYWTALPIGDRATELHHSPRKSSYDNWQQKQNNLARPHENLLVKSELDFVNATYELAIAEEWSTRRVGLQSYKARQPNLNVGSWWGSLFDQTRFALNAVKNARSWELPTAFGPRSTVSGIGPVVHSGSDWVTEGETAQLWDEIAGLFDGIEELNATEVLKRGLHRILPQKLNCNPKQLELFYPDLSSGVAGWLRRHPEATDYYQSVCEKICDRFKWTQRGNAPARQPWGIPWITAHLPNLPNPRLLNAGWLIEDFQPTSDRGDRPLTKTQKQEQTKAELRQVREEIGKSFPPGKNPTDWYVLAAGDGDGMGDWLKGQSLKEYKQYIPKALEQKLDNLPGNLPELFRAFLDCQKRMGPSSHSALSRALLDFSNQLVPYLTEERYAGRLIYSGGDDVLAYTNLWEWDDWLWDIRQCFKGDEDPQNEFISEGNYWRWNQGSLPQNLSERPLFTMGCFATISFGLTIASHSVPLAIALENLWEAEEEAKDHEYESPDGLKKKDAVQVRVLYGNGNILKATAKFKVFELWRSLLDDSLKMESAIFEQAAQWWGQHPAPIESAIDPWMNAFCSRRERLTSDELMKAEFQQRLSRFVKKLWKTTRDKDRDRAIQNWLKLAAFIVRSRAIDWRKN